MCIKTVVAKMHALNMKGFVFKISIVLQHMCMAPASVTMTAKTCTVTSERLEVTWLKSGVHVNGGTAYQGFCCA